MSWLRNTISKVGEKAEALKQSNAIKSLQSKTTTVVTSAAQQVKKAKEAVKGGGAAGAAELEAQLENRARSARTPQAAAELHRLWVTCLAAKEGYRDESSDRLLGFKEVLLKSKALEITIETIAVEPTLRKAYVEVPSGDDKASPAAALHALLGKTFACPAGLWQEVLRIALSETGPLADGHLAWLTGVVTAMKADWKEESLAAERRELALRAEYLRQEIKQLDDAQEGAAPPAAEDLSRRRVGLSADLLQTYNSVRQNLVEAQEHRKVALAARESSLNLLAEQIQSHVVGLESSAKTCSEKHKHLEGELKQSHESIQQQLQHMDDKRVEIDRELEELEARKKQLRMELDEVSRQLDETRTKQRQHMEKCDSQRRELEAVRSGFREKMDTEDAALKEAEREKTIVERARQLVSDADASVQRSLGNQLEELQKKQTLFNEHFQELLKEHLAYAEQHTKSLRSMAEACREPAERSQVEQSAQAARHSFETFRTMYGQLLEGENEAAARRVEAELDAALKAITPAAPLAAAAAATMPASSPTSGVEAAAHPPAAPPAVEAAPAAEVVTRGDAAPAEEPSGNGGVPPAAEPQAGGGAAPTAEPPSGGDVPTPGEAVAPAANAVEAPPAQASPVEVPPAEAAGVAATPSPAPADAAS